MADRFLKRTDMQRVLTRRPRVFQFPVRIARFVPVIGQNCGVFW